MRLVRLLSTLFGLLATSGIAAALIYPLAPELSGYEVRDGYIVIDTMFRVSVYDGQLCIYSKAELAELGMTPEGARTNCDHPDSWMFTGGGADITKLYGIGAACPIEVGIVNETYVGTRFYIDGIGTRTCVDAGGSVRILSIEEGPDGTTMPVLIVDVLHDFRNGWPTFLWGAGSPQMGELQIPIEYWEEVKTQMGL